ncbi:AAA family ATPase [Rhodococcus sp. KBS0724]|nr:AAA family ATPase [Rhodococcus sp. KBS0724]
MEDVFVLLLTGPPGAGKSSVSTALHDRLGEAGVKNAMIEVDELERCYPPLGTERAIAHVQMLCASYREAGYELLFLTATVEDDDYGNALVAATGADGHLLVRLEADPDTLRSRIIEREPANWAGLEQLVEASQLLAASMPALSGVDLVLSTEGRDPESVADDVEAALHERFPVLPLTRTSSA